MNGECLPRFMVGRSLPLLLYHQPDDLTLSSNIMFDLCYETYDLATSIRLY